MTDGAWKLAASHRRHRHLVAPAAAAIPENPTLGEAALQGMIEKMRKAQEEKQAAAGQKPGSRSGWRALARQVGSRERA